MPEGQVEKTSNGIDDKTATAPADCQEKTRVHGKNEAVDPKLLTAPNVT